MQICVLKSKIHRACVSGASLDYEGSLTIPEDLAQSVGLIIFEKILVANMNNGERFETYVIYSSPNQGRVELNGATAHLGKIGDRLTIMSFAWINSEEKTSHRPAVILVDEKNKILPS